MTVARSRPDHTLCVAMHGKPLGVSEVRGQMASGSDDGSNHVDTEVAGCQIMWTRDSLGVQSWSKHGGWGQRGSKHVGTGVCGGQIMVKACGSGVTGGQRGSKHVVAGVSGGQIMLDTGVAGGQQGSNHVDTGVAGGQRGSNC